MRIVAVVIASAAAAMDDSSWIQLLGDDYRAPDRESLLEMLHTVDSRGTHMATSQDRRRFMGNNKDPCQASGEPDTTNGDCYEMRWNMLKDYYNGPHKNLTRMDRHLVMAEWDAEGVLKAASNRLDSDIDVLMGSDGTIDTPSVTNGLDHEVKVLTNASRQLQGAEIASVSILYDSVLNITDTSIAGTKTLKTNIAQSYADLMNSVKRVMSNQTTRANNNTGIMLADSTRAVRTAVNSVVAQQQAAGGTVQNVSVSNALAGTAFTSNMTRVGTRLDSAGSAVDSTATGVQKKTDQAAAAVSDKIGLAAQGVTDAGQAKAADLSSQAKVITDSLSTQTAAQIAAAHDQWAQAAAVAAANAKALAAQADSRVSNVSDSVKDKIATASANTTSTISATQTSIADRTNAGSQTAKDTSAAAAALANQVKGGVSAVDAQGKQLTSTAQQSAADTQKRITDLVRAAAAASGQTVQQVLASLGATQSDAQKTASDTQANSQAQIAAFLSQIGGDGTKVAGALSSLTQMVSTGSSKANSEISSSYGQAVSGAGNVKTQLTGQLDAAGKQLTATQNSFNDGSRALQQGLNGKLADGSSSTAAAIAGLQNASAATKAALMKSLFGSMEGFTGDSDQMDAMLHNLILVLQGLGNDHGAAAAALAGTGDMTDNSIASLGAGLGESDDAVADTIDGQVKSQKGVLNKFGSDFASKSGSQMASMWTKVSQFLAQKENDADRVASDTESSEGSAMNTAKGLKQMASGLASDTDALVGETESKQDMARSDFLARLSQMAAKDNTTSSQLQALLNEYGGSAMGDIGGFLSSLVGAKNSDITNSLSQQRAEIQRMASLSTSTSANSQKLNAVIGALLADSTSSQTGLIDGILGILDSTQAGQDSFTKQINNVDAKLQMVKAGSAASLADLTQSIQSEVMKIPIILTSGAVRLQNDFQLASSDLENNILKLKEKMATAETDEERQEAMQGLVVLNKLQGVQQGVLQADAQLRSQIQSNAHQGAIDAGNVQGAMTGVLAAMTSINSQMDSAQAAVQSDTESVGKQTATLVNGLNLMINGTNDRLAHEAAQSAVESRFNLNMAQARNKVRLAAATQGVSRTLDTFGSNADSAFRHESDVRADIDRMTSTTQDSSRALGSRIDAVLTDVMSRAGSVQSDSVASEGDIITRLALVRVAMANFLGLWNEYAASMDRKLRRFHSSDAEFVSQMERELRRKLTATEQNVNGTEARIAGFKSTIELGMKEEVEFENFFTAKIQDLKSNLARLNDQRNQKTIMASGSLDQFENFQHENQAQLKQQIKNLIDQFDDTVVGKVSQADASSLMQAQIRDLESRAQAVM